MDINSAPLSPDSPEVQDNIEDAPDIDPRVEHGDRFQEIITRNGVAEAELGEGFTARFVTPTSQQMPIMSMLGTFRYIPPEQAGQDMLTLFEEFVEVNQARKAAIEIG